MTVESPEGTPSDRAKAVRKGGHATAQNPEWANGLRQLYEAVVDEPLPDAFRDLLSQLDAKD